ncbi:2-polyprenyl-6-methoxyphenol hydroxylase [Fodinibius salinus]|uniref:2-polyprenyl-6-methoxyphenol hydroxylase n=1 Tax=Fodinibius salinus TaxID=860790 RepID=A0A5D3YKS4_9BACT|nr:NAD(P)/FAD-dependent oxidoreductase [Fodinibius salinus]TYP94118.1 2-polyprenyl-6-methoxyphenol hydroxylase [Fodinibius salinus]
MTKSTAKYSVAIVGGGPVGLFLGICLQSAGVSCIILEKQAQIKAGSRSIGIHPVSLELFDKLNITSSFLAEGLKIKKGHAFNNSHKLGTLSFKDCTAPHNYILSLPQQRTEQMLQDKLQAYGSHILQRSAKVINISQTPNQVNINYNQNGETHTISASYLVGCDGKNSYVRKSAGINFQGKEYPDTYVMGDFSENTKLGNDAAIYLCDEGLIESFPLPNNNRRWVVKTEEYLPNPTRINIEERIQHRINHSLSNTAHTMLSSFGVQKLVAMPMVKKRIILAGDAAHVVSPIGGQGMNLGWLACWDLSEKISGIINQRLSAEFALKKFGQRRLKVAQKVIRRAELNMRLGRSYRFPFLRNSLVQLMLTEPFASLSAKLFTMRGLQQWII